MVSAQPTSVSERVSALTSLARLQLYGTARVAARHLYSSLSYFEEVGVMEAMHLGAPGQVEDEIVHRDTFAAVADRLGGRDPVSNEADMLIRLIHHLPQRLSIMAINLVAEVWLETVFRHLIKWHVSPDLFQSIAEDEARHYEYGLGHLREDMEGFDKVLRELEVSLFSLAFSPTFALPMHFFGGVQAFARMGLDLIKQHTAACRALGLQPGPDIAKMRKLCRGALWMVPSQPDRAMMTDWDKDRQLLFGVHNPEDGAIQVPMPVTGLKAEARVVQAVGNVLTYMPEMNVTLRDGQYYRPKQIVIGVRKQHKPSGGISTIYVVNPHNLTQRGLLKKIIKRQRKLNEVARPIGVGFCGGGPISQRKIMAQEMTDLLPPSRASIIVTFTGGYSKVISGVGWSPLIEGEGVAGSVTIGPVVDGTAKLGFRFDHRMIDGPDLVRFMEALGVELGGDDRACAS